MKYLILSLLTFLTGGSMHATTVEMPLSLLGRDFVLAARVEKVSTPFELGKMKIYPGLRVYNPQLVRFSLDNDSLVMTGEDIKRGPQRVSLPVVSRKDDILLVDIDSLFLQTIRGVDILSGRMKPGSIRKEDAKISQCKGDVNHLEVSVDYCYNHEKQPVSITIRKSLLLLNDKAMEGKPVDTRIGYKSNNSLHIDRFDIRGGKKIVFYVSDEFPLLWQNAIKQGIEDWNIAFSKFGHGNTLKAVLYSEAGEGFDPYDITHNCFYMVESDFANAMGNHWTDPRNGEILQADVQFYNGVAEKLRTWLLLHTSAYNNDVATGNIPDSVMQRALRYAAAHEIGHCLGLEHNYRASFAYDTDSLRNADFCATNGTTASIMDYARFNYVAQRGDNVTYIYPPLLGDYDIYAIEAGYRNFSNEKEYKDFISEHQSSPRFLYKKMNISALPNDECVMTSDLGNDHLKSTQYGINNIASIPIEALKKLKAGDIYNFYFQLLMHLVPCLERAEVKEFMKDQLNKGFLMLNSSKMKEAYGDQTEEIEKLRVDFINKVRKKYSLDITNDPASAGLWMPHQIVDDAVFSLLKKDGMKLSKKDIYDINKRCLSGAALSLSVDNGVASPFGSASFVSKDGLVLTNFHCVSNYVQRLAKGENDYMKYGCWTTSREQEAPLFNLQLHQLLSVEDVTDKVFAGTEGMDGEERDKTADKQARELMSSAAEAYGVTRRVYSMMGGMQYVLARYRTFSDVRVSACPPMWLGAFGGDDDNWKWPRYSCDFAFLRVYVSPQGESLEYSKENVPFHPKSYLKVARKSVKPGDLAMVMGYPSQTRKNIPAFALNKIVNNDTQLRVNALKAKIDYLRKCSEKANGAELSGYNVRIGKLMNVYLRSKGEIEGVRNIGLIDKKRKEDLQLQEWINADEARKARYGANLIEQMDSVYSLLTVYNHMDEAFSQFVGSGAGIIPFAGKFEKFMAISRSKRKSRDDDMRKEITEIQRNVREFFPSISMEEDCGMMKTLLPIYLKAVDKEYLPEALRRPLDMDHLYATSLITDSMRIEKFLAECIEKGTDALAQDTLYRICIDIYVNRVQKQNREATPLKRQNTKLYGIYMRAKAEKAGDKLMPYDASHTLRLSTGRVKGINYMSDMLNREDYKSPRFESMLKAENTPIVACFTTNAETAAGNSGSAVLNENGEIIGLNFDRTAASASSIYYSDPLTTRNIVVSIDYILWVIRNLSHSQHLLKEI